MASTAVIRQSDVFIDGYAIAMSPPHLRQRGCMQCVHGRPGSHSSCANTDPLESEERGPRCRRSPLPSVSYIRNVSMVRR
jgi:hypothetical protein